MIAALLFLILFAILFRGAFRFLLFLMFIGAIMALGEVHANPVGITYWHQLDEQCRGGSGDNEETNRACDKRLAVDKMLKEQGCKFRYPGWPALGGEYWKCPK